jgi:hypothetical protein
MGFFNNLFGKNISSINISNKTKPNQMLDEDLYWQIVDESLKNTRNQKEQEEYLVSRIQKLTPPEIIGFRLRTDKLLHDSYTSVIWCAAHIMNEGCTEENFEYFRCWIISRGKDTYYKTKENPDYLIREVNVEIENYRFEDFWYVALTAFENKTSHYLFDFIDDKFKFCEGQYPEFALTWRKDEPETMKDICPKLFDQIWLKTPELTQSYYSVQLK